MNHSLSRIMLCFGCATLGVVTSWSSVYAQSASPTQTPTPEGYFAPDNLPTVELCPEQGWTCVNAAYSYCLGLKQLNYPVYSVVVWPNLGSVAGGCGAIQMLKNESGCATETVLKSGVKEVKAKKSCVTRLFPGHKVIVAQMADERLKGGEAEFQLIDPSYVIGGGTPISIGSWRTNSKDELPSIPSYLLEQVRSLRLPNYGKYNIPINYGIKAGCDQVAKLPGEAIICPDYKVMVVP